AARALGRPPRGRAGRPALRVGAGHRDAGPPRPGPHPASGPRDHRRARPRPEPLGGRAPGAGALPGPLGLVVAAAGPLSLRPTRASPGAARRWGRSRHLGGTRPVAPRARWRIAALGPGGGCPSRGRPVWRPRRALPPPRSGAPDAVALPALRRAGPVYRPPGRRLRARDRPGARPAGDRRRALPGRV